MPMDQNVAGQGNLFGTVPTGGRLGLRGRLGLQRDDLAGMTGGNMAPPMPVGGLPPGGGGQTDLASAGRMGLDTGATGAMPGPGPVGPGPMGAGPMGAGPRMTPPGADRETQQWLARMRARRKFFRGGGGVGPTTMPTMPGPVAPPMMTGSPAPSPSQMMGY